MDEGPLVTSRLVSDCRLAHLDAAPPGARLLSSNLRWKDARGAVQGFALSALSGLFTYYVHSSRALGGEGVVRALLMSGRPRNSLKLLEGRPDNLQRGSQTQEHLFAGATTQLTIVEGVRRRALERSATFLGALFGRSRLYSSPAPPPNRGALRTANPIPGNSWRSNLPPTPRSGHGGGEGATTMTPRLAKGEARELAGPTRPCRRNAGAVSVLGPSSLSPHPQVSTPRACGGAGPAAFSPVACGPRRGGGSHCPCAAVRCLRASRAGRDKTRPRRGALPAGHACGPRQDPTHHRPRPTIGPAVCATVRPALAPRAASSTSPPPAGATVEAPVSVGARRDGAEAALPPSSAAFFPLAPGARAPSPPGGDGRQGATRRRGHVTRGAHRRRRRLASTMAPPCACGGCGRFDAAAASMSPSWSRKPLAPLAFPTHSAPPPDIYDDGGCCRTGGAQTRLHPSHKPLAPPAFPTHSAPPPYTYDDGGCCRTGGAPTRLHPSRKPLAPPAFPTYSAPPPDIYNDGGCCRTGGVSTRLHPSRKPLAPPAFPPDTSPPSCACVRHSTSRATDDETEGIAAALAAGWQFPAARAVLEHPTCEWAPPALPSPPPPHAPSVTAAVPPPSQPPPPATAAPPPPSGSVSVSRTRRGGARSAPRQAAPRATAASLAAAAAEERRATWESEPRGSSAPLVAPPTLPTAGDAGARSAAAAATSRRSTAPPPSVPAAAATGRRGDRRGRRVHGQHGGRGHGGGGRSRAAAAADAAAAAATPPARWVDLTPPMPRHPPSSGDGGGRWTDARTATADAAAAAATPPAPLDDVPSPVLRLLPSPGDRGGRSTNARTATADAAAAAATPPAPLDDELSPVLRLLPPPGDGGGRWTYALTATDEVGRTLVARGDMDGGQWRAVVWEGLPLGTGGIATIAWGPSDEED